MSTLASINGVDLDALRGGELERYWTIDQLVDTVVARVLDRLGLPNDLMKRWDCMSPRAPEPVEDP